MLHETFEIIPGNSRAKLTTYFYETKNNNADAILVIPGGGYGCVCSDREGEPIALAFAAKGLKPFVLSSYSVNEYAKYPQPLVEASAAMAHIRENAEKYGINPDRVFAVGFSAGGHLAASLGTNWHRPEVKEALNIKYGSNRPTGMILCYPVLCYMDETHKGTFYNAFGTDNPTDEQIAACSLERNVDERTCPAFFMHTADDELVNVKNSLKFADAMATKNIPFEMHVYPHGPHGMALANTVTDFGNKDWLDDRIAEWVNLAAGWIKTADFGII